MTIRDVNYDFVPDVSAKNETLSLAISPTLKLAAGVWTKEVEGSLATARLDCLHYSLGRLKANWPDWEFCLLAGHKTIQPDNRITRHRGLWKSLVAAGANLPQGEFIQESVVVSDDLILEQVEFTYDSAGNVVETVVRRNRKRQEKGRQLADGQLVV